MIEVHLYKFKHSLGGDFNYFEAGMYSALPPGRDGVQYVDSMRIVDVPPDAISNAKRSIRDKENVRVFECGYFNMKLDRQNDARSYLGKTLDEFFAKEDIKTSQYFCRYMYGTKKFEGFVDKRTIEFDDTWTKGGDDITFQVDDPLEQFYESMKRVNLTQLDEFSSMNYDNYFQFHHFGYWFNNGTVTQFEDKLDLIGKLGWARKPIISGPLQYRLFIDGLNQGYRVYDGTLSFMRGIGISLKLETVNWDPPYRIQTLPFKLTMFFEFDTNNEVQIEDFLEHRRGYQWWAKQNFIIPYWEMQPTDGVPRYYGMYMSKGGDEYQMADLWDGGPGQQIMYEIGDHIFVVIFSTDNYQLRKDETYKLELGYHAQDLFTAFPGPYPIYPAYCRILCKSYEYVNIGGGIWRYNDTGFKPIIDATAKKFYKFMAGQFKERRFIQIDYPEDTTIDAGSEIKLDDTNYRIESITGLNVERQEADAEAIEL